VRTHARARGGRRRRKFGRRVGAGDGELATNTLHIHGDRRERFGDGVDCVQRRDDTSSEQTFGIQCMHTLKTHEKLMQIIVKESLGRKTWRAEE